MQWMVLQDNATAALWLNDVQVSALEVMTATDDANLSAALNNLSAAAAAVPAVEPVTPERLLAWDATEPAAWLARLNDGENLSGDLGQLMAHLSSMTENRTPAQVGQIFGQTGPASGSTCAVDGVAERGLPCGDSVLFAQRRCC